MTLELSHLGHVGFVGMASSQQDTSLPWGPDGRRSGGSNLNHAPLPPKGIDLGAYVGEGAFQIRGSVKAAFGPDLASGKTGNESLQLLGTKTIYLFHVIRVQVNDSFVERIPDDSSIL